MLYETQSAAQSPRITITFEPGSSAPVNRAPTPGQLLDQAIAALRNNLAQASQQFPAQHQISNAPASPINGVGGPQGFGTNPAESMLQMMMLLLKILGPLFAQMGQMQANPAAQQAMPNLMGDDEEDEDDATSNNAQTTPQMPNFGGGAHGGVGGGAQGGVSGGTQGGGAHGGGAGAQGGVGTGAQGAGPSAGAGQSGHATPNAGGTAGTTPQANVGGANAAAAPQATGERVLNDTVVVKAGEVFDGQGMHFKGGPGIGDGGQSESQKPLFLLESGATLKNAQISGGDGVHVMGDANLQNVWWRDVGEDALTKKGPGDVKIEGGGAFNATDKVFQVNAGGSLSIDGFKAENFGKFMRQNGGKDFPLEVKIVNSTIDGGNGLGEAVARTDSSQAKISLAGNDIHNVKNDVLAPSGAQVAGATNLSYKPYTG